jgi:hypothetical protein
MPQLIPTSFGIFSLILFISIRMEKRIHLSRSSPSLQIERAWHDNYYLHMNKTALPRGTHHSNHIQSDKR